MKEKELRVLMKKKDSKGQQLDNFLGESEGHCAEVIKGAMMGDKRRVTWRKQTRAWVR